MGGVYGTDYLLEHASSGQSMNCSFSHVRVGFMREREVAARLKGCSDGLFSHRCVFLCCRWSSSQPLLPKRTWSRPIWTAETFWTKLVTIICTLVTRAFLALSIRSVRLPASTPQVRRHSPDSSVSCVPLLSLTRSLTGVLFCVGGRGGSGDPFRSIECYSISKNSWFFGSEMNSRRRHVGVISVAGEKEKRDANKTTI